MNNSLAPTYTKLLGDYWILWYAKSNNYSIVKPEFKSVLDAYLQSKSVNEFALHLGDADDTTTATIIQNIETYLKDCNFLDTNNLSHKIDFTAKHRNILKQYVYDGIPFQIYFDSEKVAKIIHPAIAHLQTQLKITHDTTFDIFLEDDKLYLFKDKKFVVSASKLEYHKIQGKFIMQLLCTLHNKKDKDWIGSFHGSTISDQTNSILFIGNSGKGKSTLCALLAANDFKLVADDVSAMLVEDKFIYSNPLAISIKKGAFKTLASHIKDFNALPTVVFNKVKGQLKYVPTENTITDNYPCKAIVMVNYQKNADTHLEVISVKQVLETLIPESWLSPNPLHANQFLNWLETTETYQLTYSDTDSVISEITALFNHLRPSK